MRVMLCRPAASVACHFCRKASIACYRRRFLGASLLGVTSVPSNLCLIMHDPVGPLICLNLGENLEETSRLGYTILIKFPYLLSFGLL